MRATPSDDARRPGPSPSGRHAAPGPDDDATTTPGDATANPTGASSSTAPNSTAPNSTAPDSTGGALPPGTGMRQPPAEKDKGPDRKLLAAGAAVIALALIAVIAFTFTRGDDDTSTSAPTPTASTGSGTGTTTGTRYGVYGKTSADGVAQYEQWLGADVSYVIDFSARDTWENIANPQYLLDEWNGSGYRLVYAVAMLPTGDESATIAAGAQGQYNQYFRTLAENLVANGEQNTILRIGWEFNLAESRWSSDDPESWKSFYRNIVETMRAVDGAQFEFDWNVNNGPNPYDAADYYPGDDVVDYVGVDAYDTSSKAYPYPDNCDSACFVKHQKQAWDETIYGGDRGLQFWSAFAKEHGKPLTLPEWGCWGKPDGTGGSDDPDYIQRMYDFITDTGNNVAYAAYFEYDYSSGDGGQHSLQQSFPNSAAKFKELFTTVYQQSAAS
ncbi:glycosyl hydrolase [Kineosporia succinea]|uniref:GH26 domain-containing protein n=1 Tax=Kineosporia succinea TaxID=84632 RepID=A0ABT9P3A9_9ACTN|nr:glycosyl hydrolase [Kineosporia succinea]MDP9827148.1 hypothetical protein [Kineosporia succinea]